mgnify:CR=1 FL=1
MGYNLLGTTTDSEGGVCIVSEGTARRYSRDGMTLTEQCKDHVRKAGATETANK